MAKILLVDDNPQNIELLSLRLTAAGHDTQEARNGEEALQMIGQGTPDLMILDLQMPKLDGLSVLKRLNDERIEVPVVVISAFATVERAVEAMKAGALDFITKPFDPTHLELVVERALERTNLTLQNRFLTDELNAQYHFVLGQSPVMAKVYEALLAATRSADPVLVIGEGGSGKEVAARLLHRESDRKEFPFVSVRCGAMDGDALAEALFGTPQRKGKIELAAGGILFLDEVGRLSPKMQTAIHGLITTHGFTRVGGTMVIPADVRVIAASGEGLLEAAESGFDADLFAALDATRITLPPLREHPQDIADLARYFIEKFNAEAGRDVHGVSAEALESLQAYHWPGNVRELATIIERAVAVGRTDEIESTDLGIAARAAAARPEPTWHATAGPYEARVQEARREIVLAALRDAEGDLDGAAGLLELDGSALDTLLKELGIRR